MKVKDLRALSMEELEEKKESFKKQLMELQFKRRIGVDKPHMFKRLKKDIARISTILREK